jgi:hypothetical protein
MKSVEPSDNSCTSTPVGKGVEVGVKVGVEVTVGLGVNVSVGVKVRVGVGVAVAKKPDMVETPQERLATVSADTESNKYDIPFFLRIVNSSRPDLPPVLRM